MASVGSAAHGWWIFVLVGICAGVVSGMLGVGSGTVIIPGLVLLLSLPQKSAQGMCLAAMIPMVAIGALRYKLNPDIDVSMMHAALIAVGGVAGAFAGVEIATRLSGSVLRRIFACFIIAVGLRMLIAPGGRKSAPLSGRPGGRHAPARLASGPAEEASAGEQPGDGANRRP